MDEDRMERRAEWRKSRMEWSRTKSGIDVEQNEWRAAREKSRMDGENSRMENDWREE